MKIDYKMSVYTHRTMIGLHVFVLRRNYAVSMAIFKFIQHSYEIVLFIRVWRFTLLRFYCMSVAWHCNTVLLYLGDQIEIKHMVIGFHYTASKSASSASLVKYLQCSPSSCHSSRVVYSGLGKTQVSLDPTPKRGRTMLGNSR